MMEKKYRDFWIENGSFIYGCSETKEKLNGWKANGEGPWHVIEIAALTALQAELKIQDEANDILTRQLEDANKTIKFLRGECNDLDNEVVRVRAELQVAKDDVAIIERKLISAEDELVKRANYIVEQGDQLTTAHAEIEKLKDIARQALEQWDAYASHCENTDLETADNPEAKKYRRLKSLLKGEE